MSRLLAGVDVAVHGDGAAADLAAGLLAGLGARVRREPGGPAAVVAGAVREWPGVPGGTVEVATGYAAATAALLAEWTGRSVAVDRDVVAAWVMAPALVADRWSRPPAPLAVGDGAVAADLGAPGDEQLFDTLWATLDTAVRSDPEALAAAAQEWRLPVAPFAVRRTAPRTPAPVVRADRPRRREESAAASPAAPVVPRRREANAAAPPAPARPLAGFVVCDLTAMWAGPLATRLLAMLGAEVVKVDSAVRPDGLRFWGSGHADRPSPLYAELNADKRIVDLDLRTPDGLAGLHGLLDRADVVVDSFSRRVLPSFGLSDDVLATRWPGLLAAAARAFPPGPRAGWGAYGPGIHAAAGLGDVPAAGFVAPAISYPDPLGGFLLCAAVVAQLVARERLGRVASAEVSLWDAVDPLWAFAQPARLAEPLRARDIRRLGARSCSVFDTSPEAAAA